MSAGVRYLPREDPGQPLIRETSLNQVLVCRCGTRVERGTPVFQVMGVPATERELFENRAFCSVRCIRAFCLESLEALDSLDTPGSVDIVSDLHQVYSALADTFAKILAAP